MASLGELLGQYLLGLPPEAEVVEGTRGAMLPGAKYRLPDGSERWSMAAPQGLADALQAVGAAGGRVQDPNAPEGYVSQGLIQRGAEGLAGSAAVGSLGVRAPAGALRSGLPSRLIEREVMQGLSGDDIIRKARSGGYSPRVSQIVLDADPLELGSYATSARARLNNAISASGGRPPTQSKEIGGGMYAERAGDEFNIVGSAGSVKGIAGDDPQIKTTYVGPDARGTGQGSSMYRAWAEGVGKPFRSDESVSEMAAVLYDDMFPRYGYNVLKNPDAELGVSGQWTAPNAPSDRQHIYRVEPPGMNSTEFYSNRSQAAAPGQILAQKNALDPSPAARMARAREMGFDVQGYHGTGAGDFPEFKGITWMSETPNLANEYAGMRGAGDGWQLDNPHSVMKLTGRSGAVFEADRMPKTIKRREFINEIVTQAQEQGRLTDESQIARVRDLAEVVVKAAQREESGPHYNRHDFWNNVESQFGDDGAAALNEIMDLAGFDSIRMKEGGEGTIGIRDPRNVRSTSAMFDPSKSDSANLLAANPLAGALITPGAGAQRQSGTTISDILPGEKLLTPEEVADLEFSRNPQRAKRNRLQERARNAALARALAGGI